jgi:hypothetical protein
MAGISMAAIHTHANTVIVNCFASDLTLSNFGIPIFISLK